jgi:hypothetical protein
MSMPEQPLEQEIAPWADTVSYYDDRLQLTLEMPGDWQAGTAPDCPLQITAPPRGQPPYQVGIRVFVNAAPPGPEFLPLVAEEIFNSAHTQAMLDYSGSDVVRLVLGSMPAFLHRSSWTLQLPDGRRFDLRQQMLVVAALDKLYIFSLVVPPYLTDVASAVFINMIQTARYGSIEPDEAEVEPVASENRATPTAALLDRSTRVEANGRWRSQRSRSQE